MKKLIVIMSALMIPGMASTTISSIVTLKVVTEEEGGNYILTDAPAESCNQMPSEIVETMTRPVRVRMSCASARPHTQDINALSCASISATPRDPIQRSNRHWNPEDVHDVWIDMTKCGDLKANDQFRTVVEQAIQENFQKFGRKLGAVFYR